MDRIKSFLKQEAVLSAAGLLALLSLFLVPPDAAYLGYIDFSTLGMLTSLMLVVAGFTAAGVFRALTAAITRRVSSPRTIAILLVLVCFVSSAFVTNDVALITFVPFTIGLLGTADNRRLIWVIVVETVAANLGSLLTPMGNPQNLFLYHYYGFTAPEFLAAMLPLGAVSLVVCVVLALVTPRGAALTASASDAAPLDRRQAIFWGVLFALCVASVAGFLPWPVCLVLTCAAALLRDRSLFRRVDVSLLATFVCFFIFVGNVSRIDAVSAFLRDLMAGREVVVGALVSQCISNVPAAAMLAAFTDNARGLLYGVNIGGLGTIIASMASLISYRRYAAAESAQKGRYMAVFSVVNVGLLVGMLVVFGF